MKLLPLWVRASSPSFLLSVAFGASARMVQLEGWFKSWVPDSVFSAGGVVGVRLRPGVPLHLTKKKCLQVLSVSNVHVFVADVVKSFDTVDRGILDRVLCSLGLPAWFRHAYFEFHAHVRLRFKLAAGLGEPWTRDGNIPQGCHSSVMFIVALYLPWCRYLENSAWCFPELYAENLKCVCMHPVLFLHAARFTTGMPRLVGQEPPCKVCPTWHFQGGSG